MRKHIFLLASIGMLTFMALTTEKKVLITTGYAITEEELALGRAVYQHSCRSCHQQGENGAPAVNHRKAWESYLAGGMEKLLQKGLPGCMSSELHAEWHSNPELSRQEIAAATAFMIRRSRQ